MGILIVNFLVPASLGSMCCGQHMITILYLGRGLSFCIKLKNVHQNVIFLKEELGFYLMAELLFLTCFPLLLHSLTSLISNRLNVLFRTQGRPETTAFFYWVGQKLHLGFSVTSTFWPSQHKQEMRGRWGLGAWRIPWQTSG